MPPEPIRKVLMTADSVGGVWTYALQLASEFGERGIEVTLVVMGGKPSPDQAREAGAIKNLGAGRGFEVSKLGRCQLAIEDDDVGMDTARRPTARILR